MTNNIGARVWLVDVSQILLVGLFLYSAVSKVLDYHDFNDNLMRSPLLEAKEVPIVSYSIIIVELATVAMLIVSKTMRFAFALAFFLLVSFSLYLTAVLVFFQDTPCPCGGLLSTMGFGPHIALNLVATVLAVIGFVKYETPNRVLRP